MLSLGRPKAPTLVHICSPRGQEAGRRLGARETVLVCAQHRRSALSPELPSLGHLLWTRGRPLGLVGAHADSSAAGGRPSETRPAGSRQGLPEMSAWDFPAQSWAQTGAIPYRVSLLQGLTLEQLTSFPGLPLGLRISTPTPPAAWLGGVTPLRPGGLEGGARVLGRPCSALRPPPAAPLQLPESPEAETRQQGRQSPVQLALRRPVSSAHRGL